SNTFLLGESNHLDAKWQPRPVERFHKGESDHDAEHAIKGAGMRHRIEMRPDEETSRIGRGALIDAAEVASRVDRNTHSGGAHPCGQLDEHHAHTVGEKRTRREPGLVRAPGKDAAPADDVARALDA